MMISARVRGFGCALLHVVAFADHAYTMVFVVQEIFTLEAVFEDRRASDIEDD
jgi:hypothetical protein